MNCAYNIQFINIKMPIIMINNPLIIIITKSIHPHPPISISIPTFSIINMNYLKAALRVKLNRTNPCTPVPITDKLKQQYKLFSHPLNNRITTKLVGKNRINNDYVILRLQLPTQNKCLGIQIGQYIWIQLNDKKRQYVPISPIDDPNYIDLLVRDMSKLNVGSFTQKLLQLPIQSQINIIGPGTQFIYQGYGKLKYTQQSTKQQISRVYKNIGIITHSSAISTTFSMIQSISMNYDSRTGISLLWLGDKQQDFIFIQQLLPYVEQCKLNMNIMLTQFKKGWLGPYGKVTQFHIQDYMPFPNQNNIILMSGINQILPEIPQLIKNMGYTHYLNL